MLELYGQCNGPLVLLHGGAGTQDPSVSGQMSEATKSLVDFAQQGFAKLQAGKTSGLDIVTECLGMMEKSELFNAGRGAALQSDGQARLTAALMDGTKQSFSGVISVSYLDHPSRLALHLQKESARVLTSPGAEILARRLQEPVSSQVTIARAKRWLDCFTSGQKPLFDTVGCVVRDSAGRIFAGTSTGGRGFETPGRVSDAATVAGTYASKFAGISATGHGEEIVDDAVCARIETRCRDGATLKDAVHRTFEEAKENSRAYGLIAAGLDGAYAIMHTTPGMSYAAIGAQGIIAKS